MNKNYTLKELVKVYAETYCQTGRDAGIKAVLDFIGYELPKDKEREVFEKWCESRQPLVNHVLAKEDQFAAWKAGRDELRKAGCSAQCRDTKTEPDWTPWSGGSKSPIVEKHTRYEVKFRDGEKWVYTQNNLRWSHDGTAGDIMAYRILES